MQAAALSLVLWLCLAAWGSPAPEELQQQPPEEEALVVPVRLESSAEPRRPPEAAGARLYSLAAFGERLRLELRPDSSFLAPELTLQYVGRRPRSGGEEEDFPDGLANCFYSGTVNGDPGSAAALSLCGGLRGAFYLRGVEYLIQPGNASRPRGGGGGGGEEEKLQLHILRRRARSSARRSPGGGAKCGVADEGDPSSAEGERRQAEHVQRAGIGRSLSLSLARSR